MKDTILVLSYFFSWKFFLLFGCMVGLGLSLPDSKTKIFRSIRFNAWLFLVIAVASAYGTFLPLEKQPVVYHSWWFAALIALMGFDVVVCKLRGLPKKIRLDFFSKSSHREEARTRLSQEDAQIKVLEWFVSKKIKPTVKESAEGVVVSGSLHHFQRWGDFILHVSIVIVLAGSLMGVMFGFEEVAPIAEGELFRLKNRPWSVFLKDFDVQYYKGTGAPSLYSSDLEVFEGEKSLGKKHIVVNDPLDIDRVRFYQASWGMTEKIEYAILHVAGINMKMTLGEVVGIPNTPLSIRINSFNPSFALDNQARVITTDLEGKNPALQVDFLEKKEVQARLWVLEHDTHVAYRILGDKVMPVPPPPFFILEIKPILFSGVQVAFDPGAPLFWLGVILLTIGLCIHFYMHNRQIRVLISKIENETFLKIGGWNSRPADEFKREFSTWVSEIRAIVS